MWRAWRRTLTRTWTTPSWSWRSTTRTSSKLRSPRPLDLSIIGPSFTNRLFAEGRRPRPSEHRPLLTVHVEPEVPRQRHDVPIMLGYHMNGRLIEISKLNAATCSRPALPTKALPALSDLGTLRHAHGIGAGHWQTVWEAHRAQKPPTGAIFRASTGVHWPK